MEGNSGEEMSDGAVVEGVDAFPIQAPSNRLNERDVHLLTPVSSVSSRLIFP